MLWIGAGKTVNVYQPSIDPHVQFTVTQRALTPSKPTGDITCGAVVNSEPDKIYFGHSDGKVSVYSRSKLNCVDVVNVSLYKINSMSGVGDYLWAGFKTGMIYVYDVRTKPWRVLKDWQCSNGPVVQVIADRTSIWKVGRLQVVSLGVDNIIRLWDGMLEDDWLESEMQSHDVEFCDFREVKALLCTWNAGAVKPQDLLVREDDIVFLEKVLASVDSPDIIVFGFQELVDLENKKITASMFYYYLVDLLMFWIEANIGCRVTIER
jgi:WD40 repeat protein